MKRRSFIKSIPLLGAVVAATPAILAPEKRPPVAIEMSDLEQAGLKTGLSDREIIELYHNTGILICKHIPLA